MPRTKSNLSRRSRAARHGKRRRLNETEEERRKRINVIRTYFLLARARESSTERAKRLAIQRMRQAKYRKAKKYATERALKIHHLIVPSTSSQISNSFEIELQPHFDPKEEKPTIVTDTKLVQLKQETEYYDNFLHTNYDPQWIKSEISDFLVEDPFSKSSDPYQIDTVFSSSESPSAVIIKTECDENEFYIEKTQYSEDSLLEQS